MHNPSSLSLTNLLLTFILFFLRNLLTKSRSSANLYALNTQSFMNTDFISLSQSFLQITCLEQNYLYFIHFFTSTKLSLDQQCLECVADLKSKNSYIKKMKKSKLKWEKKTVQGNNIFVI